MAETEAAVVGGLLADAGLTPRACWPPGSTIRASGMMPSADCARLSRLVRRGPGRRADRSERLGRLPGPRPCPGRTGRAARRPAQWLLLRRHDRSRALLDLGRTTRLTYLPADTSERAAAAIRAFEVGPGTALLDLLAYRLSNGQHHFDSGGCMAAQGRRHGELVDRWLLDPCFHAPLPRWHPRGVRPERFLTEALQLAVASGWSVRDLLCTATHFIAETVALALRKTLPEDAPLDELIVTGGGQHNGMLLRGDRPGRRGPGGPHRRELAQFRVAGAGLRGPAGHASSRRHPGQRPDDHGGTDAADSRPAHARLAEELAAAFAVLYRQRAAGPAAPQRGMRGRGFGDLGIRKAGRLRRPGLGAWGLRP